MSNVWNREDLAWAAGFVDGEGNIRLSTTKSRKTDQRQYCHIVLSVAQCDRRVLDKLQGVLHMGTVYGPYKAKRNNHRDFYRFTTHSFEESQCAIGLLWNWLGCVKRDQATNSITAYHKFNARPCLKMGPKPISVTCHPDREHMGHGLCAPCFQRWYHQTIRKPRMVRHDK